MAPYVFRWTYTDWNLLLVPSFALAKTHGAAVALGFFGTLLCVAKPYFKIGSKRGQWKPVNAESSDCNCPLALALF